jgi:hypothetical protein
MSDEHPIVVLSIAFENTQEVIGVFGPYESEFEAGKHVGIFRDPEMLKRRKRVAHDLHQPVPAGGSFGLHGAGGGTVGRVDTEPLVLGFAQAPETSGWASVVSLERPSGIKTTLC